MSTAYTFKDNKYTRWYFNIIDSAKKQNRNKADKCYYENHHIIPKSLGGSDRILNLVLLTAKEHFVVHLLLVKMVDDSDVYRMVNAIRRFTSKARNATEYNLLRSMISRFSKGRLNPSYGKKWIHHTHTKEILYIPESTLHEYDSSIYQVGLPYQRGGHSNTIWMNDGRTECMVSFEESEELLNLNWSRGRLNEPSVQQLCNASSARHTPEKDKEHSQKLKGRVTIINLKTRQVKRIPPASLDKYLTEGYILSKGTGHVKRKTRPKTHV